MRGSRSSRARCGSVPGLKVQSSKAGLGSTGKYHGLLVPSIKRLIGFKGMCDSKTDRKPQEGYRERRYRA